MQKIKKKSTLSKRLCALFFMLIAILLTTSIGGCFAMKDDKDSISELSFSHDGKKVVFDRCRNEGCQIQVYDLETGELAAYQSPKGERLTMGKYSYDGKRIAFSVIPTKSGGGLELGEMQIAVMDADGKNLRKVTTGPGGKLYPAFSHSGKKVLYARAAHIREGGKTPAMNYDAWDVDLETGMQTQLTFCKYFYMGYLTYYPDDERFIYYGELPGEFEGVQSYHNETAFGKKMVELAGKGMDIHGVVVMKGKEMIPNPYNFPAKVFPQKPLLSQDGTRLIYEKSMSAGKFYLYSADGNHLFAGGGGSIDSATISPDGELLGINYGKTINIYWVKDGKLKVQFYNRAATHMENWDNDIRKNPREQKMIPDLPSRIYSR